MRILAPLIAAFIFVVLLLFSQPSFFSGFWERADGVVTGYEEVAQGDPFYGTPTRPLLRLADGRIVPLRAGPGSAEAIAAQHPVGAVRGVKLSPGGVAWMRGQVGALFWPTLVFLGICGVTLAIRTALRFGLIKPAPGELAVIGVRFAFLILPAGLLAVVAHVGEVPPRAILWERVEAQVLSAGAAPFQLNGNTWAYVDVMVETAQGAERLGAVTIGFVTVQEAGEIAQRYETGGTHTALRSPEGGLYAKRWRFADVVAIALAMATVLFGFIALRLMPSR